MISPESYPFAGGAVCVFTTPSPVPGRRNEDSACVIPVGEERGLVVVADGMGGCPDGEQASKIAVETFELYLKDETGADGDLDEVILAAFREANRRIEKHAEGSGTTVVAAEIGPEFLRTYHCGDSRALVVGERGRIKLRTVDHSPVGHAVEQGILTPEQAMHHHQRHFVSNYMGSQAMKIEVSDPVRIQARDTLVMASDGLFDNLLDREVVEELTQRNIRRVTQRLVDLSRDRMRRGDRIGKASKPDDLTVLVFRPGRKR
jgi:serine/threonine protein phosphatase PrpC